MKLAFTFLAALLPLGLSAQLTPPTPPLPSPAPSPYQIVERGAHYNIFEGTILLTNQTTGQIVPHLGRYTQLGNGLNYSSGGQWKEANEQFSIALDGSA